MRQPLRSIGCQNKQRPKIPPVWAQGRAHERTWRSGQRPARGLIALFLQSPAGNRWRSGLLLSGGLHGYAALRYVAAVSRDRGVKMAKATATMKSAGTSPAKCPICSGWVTA